MRCLCDFTELERLAPAWQDLIARAPETSPFQSPEWTIEWYRAFGSGRLQVLVDGRPDALRAIAPFFVRPARLHEPTALALIGTGNSDTLDVIFGAAPDADDVVGAAIEDAFANGWRCAWHRLRVRSPLLHANAQVSDVYEDTPCPEVALPESNDRFDASLGGKFRRNVGYGRRRAERIGRVRFETARGDGIQKCLDDLFRLHEERWSSKATRGVLADPDVQRFHRAVAVRLDRSGRLRLVRMRIGGETAAVYYGFQMGRRACFYIAGFNPAFAGVSPGSLIIREVIRGAIDDGVTVFDFLAGRERYKYEWGARDRKYFTRIINAADQAPLGAPEHVPASTSTR